MAAATPRMIQVRNVPSALHRELVRRAKRRGLTLTQYVESVLERDVARPLPEDVYARIASRERLELSLEVAEVVRQGRSEREAALDAIVDGTERPSRRAGPR